MTHSIFILAAHTCREHFRNRSFIVTIVFSLLMLYMSLLLGALAIEQEQRVLMDFGLSFIELMGFGLALWGSATGILQEMENKTIYLILSRPISRWSYLVGRYCGLLASVSAACVAMGALHLGILFYKGWAWQPVYGLGFCGILLKLSLACALGQFWSLASTSALSGLTITAIMWLLGHFIPEINFLVRRTDDRMAAVPMLALAYILPNLQLFNFRDRLHIPSATGFAEPLMPAAAYVLVYAASWLFLSYLFFRKKEL